MPSRRNTHTDNPHSEHDEPSTGKPKVGRPRKNTPGGPDSNRRKRASRSRGAGRTTKSDQSEGEESDAEIFKDDRRKEKEVSTPFSEIRARAPQRLHNEVAFAMSLKQKVNGTISVFSATREYTTNVMKNGIQLLQGMSTVNFKFLSFADAPPPHKSFVDLIATIQYLDVDTARNALKYESDYTFLQACSLLHSAVSQALAILSSISDIPPTPACNERMSTPSRIMDDRIAIRSWNDLSMSNLKRASGVLSPAVQDVNKHVQEWKDGEAKCKKTTISEWETMSREDKAVHVKETFGNLMTTSRTENYWHDKSVYDDTFEGLRALIRYTKVHTFLKEWTKFEACAEELRRNCSDDPNIPRSIRMAP